MLETVGDDAVSDSKVVVRTERDLDGGDGRVGQNLFELLARHIGNTDGASDTGFERPTERASRGGEWDSRVGRVQEENVDGHPAERRDARGCVIGNALCPTIGDPRASVATHAAFGDDAGRGNRSSRSPRLGDQSLIVPEIGFTFRVSPCGIEEPDARIEGCRQGGERHGLVAYELRRQPHAPETDPHGHLAPSQRRSAITTG
jgi:hypothetical protein